MTNYSAIGIREYFLILLWILIQSCTTVPQANFYEVDGIVSIESQKITDHQGWMQIEHFSEVSLIPTPDSSGYIEPLSASFYVRKTGNYSLWILDNSDSSDLDKGNVSFSLLDELGNQLYQTLIRNDSSSPLRWNNHNYDDQPITIQIYSPGHYRAKIRPFGLDGYSISKIHLTMDNENPPQGAGLPSTSDPRLDPLLQKREQRVELPPSLVLGPVHGGYTAYLEETLAEEIFFRSGITAHELREWNKSPDYGQFEVRDLRKNIELMANPEFITYETPYASYDVGGFDYSVPPPFNEELLIRWAQFSAFNSVMHLFTREVYDTMVEKNQLSEESFIHVNELIYLRSRLFPYIYSENHLARGTGIKPIRGSSDFPTQYMFGDSFLVAPMVVLGQDDRFVYLPSGIWYDYVDGTRYEGGQSWLVEAPLYKIPIFVKAGSIIPYRTDRESLYKAHHDSLLIEVYGGSVGTFRLYEDDGLSTRYQQGGFSTTAFRYFERKNYATFTIGRVVREFEGQSLEKVMTLKFKYVQIPKSVSANAVVLKEGNGIKQWYYDNINEQLILHWVQPNDIKTDIEIKF